VGGTQVTEAGVDDAGQIMTGDVAGNGLDLAVEDDAGLLLVADAAVRVLGLAYDREDDLLVSERVHQIRSPGCWPPDVSLSSVMRNLGAGVSLRLRAEQEIHVEVRTAAGWPRWQKPPTSSLSLNC
jgi:hypothetical protein